MSDLPIVLAMVGCEKAAPYAISDLLKSPSDNLAEAFFITHFIEQLN
jgi:hypothetical protein